VYVLPLLAASLRWSAALLSSRPSSGFTSGGACSSSELSFDGLVMYVVCKPMLIYAWESRGKPVTIATRTVAR
jgi:hypothetical protein